MTDLKTEAILEEHLNQYEFLFLIYGLETKVKILDGCVSEFASRKYSDYLNKAKKTSELNRMRVDAILNVARVLERKGEKLEQELMDSQRKLQISKTNLNLNEEVKIESVVGTEKIYTFFSDIDGNCPETDPEPVFYYRVGFEYYLHYFMELFEIDPKLHADWFYEYLELPVPLQVGKSEPDMINIMDLPEPIRVFVEACKYPSLRQDNYLGSSRDYDQMLKSKVKLLEKKHNVFHRDKSKYFKGLSTTQFDTLKMLINYDQEEMLKKFYK